MKVPPIEIFPGLELAEARRKFSIQQTLTKGNYKNN